MSEVDMSRERKELAEQLHKWYLEATKELNPESFNAKAQKPYEDLTPEQKFIDIYIADSILEKFVYLQELRDWNRKNKFGYSPPRVNVEEQEKWAEKQAGEKE